MTVRVFRDAYRSRGRKWHVEVTTRRPHEVDYAAVSLCGVHLTGHAALADMDIENPSNRREVCVRCRGMAKATPATPEQRRIADLESALRSMLTIYEDNLEGRAHDCLDHGVIIAVRNILDGKVC